MTELAASHGQNQQEFLSVREAADLVSYTTSYVCKLAREGKINAKANGHGWLIDAESLKLFSLQAEKERDERNRLISEERRQERLEYLESLRVAQLKSSGRYQIATIIPSPALAFFKSFTITTCVVLAFLFIEIVGGSGLYPTQPSAALNKLTSDAAESIGFHLPTPNPDSQLAALAASDVLKDLWCGTKRFFNFAQRCSYDAPVIEYAVDVVKKPLSVVEPNEDKEVAPVSVVGVSGDPQQQIINQYITNPTTIIREAGEDTVSESERTIIKEITQIQGRGTGESISSLQNSLSQSVTTESLTLSGKFNDSTNSPGVNGYVLQSTGVATQWVATSSLGISGGSSTPSAGSVSSTTLAISNWTNGYVLQASTTASGGFDWVATSTLGISGGSGATTFLALTDTPSAYTANRILYTTGSAVASSSALTFDGTTFTTNYATTTGLTVTNHASSSNLTVSNALTLSSITNGLLQVDGTGVVSASTSIASSFIEDVFLRNDADDTTTGQLTAANFVASGASATSTFAGGLNVDSGGLVYNLSTNRVGIGTTTPAYLLDVDGQVGITNDTASVYGLTLNLTHPNANGINFTGTGNIAIADSKTDGPVIQAVAKNTTDTLISLTNTGAGTNIDSQVSTSGAVAGSFNSNLDGLAGRFTNTSNVGLGAVQDLVELSHTNQTANGGGAALYWSLMSSAPTARTSGRISNLWIDNTDGAEQAATTFEVIDNGTLSEVMRLQGSNASVGTTTANARLSVQSTGTNDILNIFETGGTEVFTVLESGNVGIGTTSPQQLLQISGSGNQKIRLEDYAEGDYWDLAFNDANDTFSFDFNGSSLFTIVPASGNVGIGTTSPAYLLDVDGDFRVGEAGQSNAFFVDATNARIGIGNASPSYTVDAAGVINISDTSVGYAIGGTRYFYASTTNDSIAIGENAGAALQSDGIRNVAIGFEALQLNTTGDNNVAIGYQVLQDATTAGQNIGLGREVLTNTVDGGNNIALGVQTMRDNIEGGTNIAIGYQAMLAATTSDNNIAIGRIALYNVTTGIDNVGLGENVLNDLTTGSDNIAIGENTAELLISGSDNIGIGENAISDLLTGSGNIAIGDHALLENEGGGSNVAIGSQASRYNMSATNTVAIGYRAGWGTSGQTASGYNTFIGYLAGSSNTTGNYNTLLGYQAGDNLTSGSNNIIISNGTAVDAPSATGDNQLNIGNTIHGDLSTGFIGINDSSPAYMLTVGDGDLFGVNSSGIIATQSVASSSLAISNWTNGYVLQASTTASGGFDWVATSTLGIGGGGGSGTVNSGTAGQIAYYESGGTAVSGTSTIFITGEQVGIGDTSPSQLLDIDGTNPQALIEESITEFLRIGVGETSGDSIVGWDDADDLHFGVYSSPTDTTISSHMKIEADGDVAIGATSNIISRLVVEDTGAQIQYAYNTSNYWYNQVASDGALNLSSAGTDPDFSINSTDFFIESSNNYVGIGDFSPSQLLDIDGTNPQILVEESTTEFLRIGVGETSADSIIGWDDGDELHFGVYSSPTDTTINSWMSIGSTGAVSMGNGLSITSGELSLSGGGITTGGDIDPDSGGAFNLGDATLRWGCLYYTTGTTGTCASDERLKNNIADADFGESPLAKLSALRPRTYLWNDDPTSSTNYGFIAQELLAVAPELVSLGDDGFYKVHYGMVQYLDILALQELNLKLEDIATTTLFADLENDSFSKRFFDKLIAWFADGTNGIGEMAASIFNATEKICVDGECLTADDIRLLKESANIEDDDDSDNDNSGGGGNNDDTNDDDNSDDNSSEDDDTGTTTPDGTDDTATSTDDGTDNDNGSENDPVSNGQSDGAAETTEENAENNEGSESGSEETSPEETDPPTEDPEPEPEELTPPVEEPAPAGG